MIELLERINAELRSARNTISTGSKMIERRSFITGLIALVAAPAIVRAGSLMPVKRMIEPLATVDAANQIGSQIIVNGLSNHLMVGDVISFDGVMHPRGEQRLFVVISQASKGEKVVNIYPPILTPRTPVEYGYGPTVTESPRNRAELKLVEWPPSA